ncbi:MAG: hypothetical protein C4539_00495 [Ignavibacteriales bacterium]|nr:MAG: hypothetical protein C4539_00495 [Ignavibacteriales bacterium]
MIPDIDNLLSKPVGDADFCVLDFETTGTSAYSSRAIEIGLVKVKNLEITESYRTFINPGREIPYFITQLTGIQNSDVYDAPYFDEIAPKVLDFIGESIVVAHNVLFDLSFMKSELKYAGIDKFQNLCLCTLKLARKMYPELKSKSLGSVVKHLGVTHKNVHRALGDATVTAKILLKMISELTTQNKIKTVSDIINLQHYPVAKDNFRLIKKKLVNDFLKIPNDPGVYLFKNSKDEIIYVGKAKALKERVKSYFSSSTERKVRKIVRLASKLDFLTTNSELTALLAEAELIKLYNPSCNIQLKKYGQTYFIKINKQTDFANIELSSKFDFDDNDYFGPYNNQDVTKNMIEIINKTFLIRECNDKEWNKKKECFLAQIDRCIAPCTHASLKEEYKSELQNVYDFLAAKNQLAVNRLLNKMKSLSEKQKYEEAGQIRDLVNLILSQIHKTSIIAEPINLANLLLVINNSDKKDFILLISGKVFVKQNIVPNGESFDDALDDYFNNVISLFNNVEKRDLEKVKIALSWLARNRTNVKVFYLKNYSSKQELFTEVSNADFTISTEDSEEM